MIRQVVTVQGKRFALVPPAELRRLERLAEIGAGSTLPPLPPADAEGNRPALAFARVSIARDIIQERMALGISQSELARLAGLRQETICRLESGRYSPTVRTVQKIDRALKQAATAQRGKQRGSSKKTASDRK